MIKFTCDACGKDISEKVHCSIRQFYPSDHFKKKRPEGVEWGAMRRQIPEGRGAAKDRAHRVYFDVELLDEFSKAIHAHAWGISSARIYCSKCAMKHGHRKNGKVMTIFTRIGTSHGEPASVENPPPL